MEGKEKSGGRKGRAKSVKPRQVEYALQPLAGPPKGYPRARVPDGYSPVPFKKTYRERKKAFIGHCLRNPSSTFMKGYYYELARLYAGKGPVHEGFILGALEYIDERLDCSDFVMLGIVRLLYQFPRSPLVGETVRRRAGETLLAFKYWPDEPGVDSLCTWTENHQIMYSANEYLAGQLYPDRVFVNSGMTGLEKMERARRRIAQWMDLRFRTGFSEWLSHVYYDEDITALVNLVDFARDPVIVRGAEIILDLLFADMALNSFRGAFGSSHGRSYMKEKKSALHEATADTSKLLFGTGVFAGADNMGAVALALSPSYRLPRVIREMALDGGPFLNRQRMGINVREAARWGLDRKKPEDAMTLLSMEAYTHPLTINTVIDLFDRYGWWENRFFEMFKQMQKLISFARAMGLLPLVAQIFEQDITRNTREEVNLAAYKTPDYLLGSAQDYKPGYGGDQQHIWQATLGPEAVCFTTHPGGYENESAGYWVGSGSLPRVAQERNVAVIIYRISSVPGIYKTNRLFFTHAYLPRDKFDEVVEKEGWVIARKNKGYLALYSRNGYRWQREGEDRDRELIAPGKKNIWICELGREADNGSFTEFIEAVTARSLEFRGLSVRYHSPSRGTLEFGWRGPLRVDGEPVSLKDYPRYGNPYCEAPFPPEEIVFRHGKHHLRLNLSKGIRETDEYV